VNQLSAKYNLQSTDKVKYGEHTYFLHWQVKHGLSMIIICMLS